MIGSYADRVGSRRVRKWVHHSGNGRKVQAELRVSNCVSLQGELCVNIPPDNPAQPSKGSDVTL